MEEKFASGVEWNLILSKNNERKTLTRLLVRFRCTSRIFRVEFPLARHHEYQLCGTHVHAHAEYYSEKCFLGVAGERASERWKLFHWRQRKGKTRKFESQMSPSRVDNKPLSADWQMASETKVIQCKSGQKSWSDDRGSHVWKLPLSADYCSPH